GSMTLITMYPEISGTGYRSMSAINSPRESQSSRTSGNVSNPQNPWLEISFRAGSSVALASRRPGKVPQVMHVYPIFNEGAALAMERDNAVPPSAEVLRKFRRSKVCSMYHPYIGSSVSCHLVRLIGHFRRAVTRRGDERSRITRVQHSFVQDSRTIQ